ncbi:MAG: Mpo1-like protein [Betaproteobacteria bacterium]
MPERYASFAAFYPFYLSEHSNRTCRRLHFVGTSLVVLVLAAGLFTRDARWFIAAPFVGYGFAWVGHFMFEKNRPATFTYPLYSLIGDWVMWKDILIGRIRF